jgi:proline dehydrogenase
MVVYHLIYKHFCAGRDKAEVQQTIAEIKKLGYSGVILCYSKEVMARTDAMENQFVEAAHDEELTCKDIEEWRDGNLATLSTVGEGDYIGVKYARFVLKVPFTPN